GRAERSINAFSSVNRSFAFFKMKIKSVWELMKTSKKTLTFITVVCLFFVFIWSVFLGFQRRKNFINNEKIKLTKDLINQKLTTAEEVAFLNIDRALILIKESKDEIEKLKQETKNKTKEIKELEEMVEKIENKILKKDLKTYNEFFDLTVDDKNAKGDRFYLVDSNLLISNKEKGVIYNLSLEKKSLEKNQFSEIKSADLVAGFFDEIFFYKKDKGIYKIDNEKKLKRIIEKDSRWGKIIDMTLYNGNIYLLDKDKDEIWKYLKGEDVYSSISSYFRLGEAVDLGSINSMAIDGSIYLAGESLIFKYTSGKKEEFKINLPEKRLYFDKVFTTKDLEKIYLWDKSKGKVYVISKTGEYIEQINSEILSKGSDLVVYKDKIYVLKDSKIYIIDK
ncbi:MAG: hypothetical protein NC935_08250, partial [Candidatus Omnitrophica bacterium]|nr:hypothetical protein [Candidatus Omnitrophota bacterium]